MSFQSEKYNGSVQQLDLTCILEDFSMIPGEARLYVVGTLWQLCADPPLSHHSPQDNRNTPPTKLAAGRASCCCWTKSDESRNNNLSARASLLLVRISVSSFKINFFTTGFRSKHIYLLSGSPMITEHFLILKKIELNFNFRHSLRKSNNYIAVSGPGRMRDNSFELVALVVAGWARQQPVCIDGRTDGQTRYGLCYGGCYLRPRDRHSLSVPVQTGPLSARSRQPASCWSQLCLLSSINNKTVLCSQSEPWAGRKSRHPTTLNSAPHCLSVCLGSD